MSSVRLICFKLHKTDNIFRLDENLNPFTQPNFPVYWSSDDSMQLSISLNNQVRNNFMEFQAIRFSCEERVDQVFNVVTINNQVYIQPFNITPQQEEETCQLFLQRCNDYTEIISRDQDALNYDEIKVDLYAHVLIYNNIYQGHIYSWLSDTDPNYCFAMGIRNRFDAIFTRYLENNLKNVFHYLLESVRRFALSKGANKIIITYPKSIMIKLLPALGFEKTIVSSKLLGQSLSPRSSGDCTNCYQLIDIIKPIISINMKFLLID